MMQIRSSAQETAPTPALPSVALYMHTLAGGGAERQTLVVAQGLQAAGHPVTLVLHAKQGELASQVPAHLPIVELRGRRTLHDIVLLARYLRRERPNVLVANLDHNNVAAALAKAVAASRTKLIICQHNALAGEFARQENRSYRAIPLAYRLVSPLVAAAVGVSDGVAEELVRMAGLPRHKVMTIHNGVIGEGFRSQADASVDHPWFADQERPVFATAGRLVPQKDHATLLRALARYRQAGGSGRLVVLGAGPLQSSLQELARSLGLADAVAFVGFQANPLPWFRQSQAFVSSARSEGFGNVLVEAMGCGTPVIATDCDYGPREILQRGRYGVLVRPDDPTALANAMLSAAELPARFPAGLLRARAAEFSTALTSRAFGQLICQLMSGEGRGRRVLRPGPLSLERKA